LIAVTVTVIAATGAFQAWSDVGLWAGMIQTAYGLRLSVKIALRG
jgi:hypothetical protein